MTMMRAPDSLFGKGSAPSGHWAECAAQMQLTPEQVQHLFSIREAFCKRAAALRDQRRALVRASTQVRSDCVHCKRARHCLLSLLTGLVIAQEAMSVPQCM